MRIAPLALVIECALLGGCDVDRQAADLDTVERTDLNEDEEVMHAPRVPIGDVLENPARYDGQTVRIRGEIREMLNPRAFVLEANGLLGTKSVLVLTHEPANPMGWLLQPGQQAIAVGLVRTGDAAFVERQLGRSLEPEVRRSLGKGPAVIARSIGRVHGDNIDWTAPAGIRSPTGIAR